MTTLSQNGYIQSIGGMIYPPISLVPNNYQVIQNKPLEVKRMTDEKIITLKRGFKERKDSTKEICIVEVNGENKLTVDKVLFDEIKKTMNW